MSRRWYRGTDFKRALTIEELRGVARQRTPHFAFEYVEGGAEDEHTLRRNRSVFDDYVLLPNTLVDVSQRNLKTTVFGREMAAPFAIAPTGFNGMLTHKADVALARAAKAAGIPFTLSTVSTASIEEVASAAAGARHWMQLYVLRSREFAKHIVERALAADYEALLVTTDVPVFGHREWDKRNFARPMQLSLRSKLDVLRHPRWLFDVMIPHGVPRFGNLSAFLPKGQDSAEKGVAFVGQELDQTLDWEAMRWVRDLWPRKLVIKGVLGVDDARRAVEIGADGIVLTNHGGRQLDSTLAPLEVLPQVRAAVGDKLTLLIDSGFRRGADIVKARALGADAVLLGRATLYGVAAGGEAGAAHALEILRSEVDRVLALIGRPDINQVGPDCVMKRGS